MAAAIADTELVFVALREGRTEEALALADAAVEALQGHAIEGAMARAARGEARAAAGLPGAEADLDAAVAVLRQNSPSSVPRALCTRARALRDLLSLAEAEQGLAAGTLLPGSPVARELARTRGLLGGGTVRG